MRKYIYTILLVCIGFCLAGNVSAQCSPDWTFNVTATPSTCQENGVITVTLGGTLTNIDQTRVEYSVEGKTPGANTTSFDKNNVMANLAPGTYTVKVRAFCELDGQFTPVKEQQNVVVGGNYTPLGAMINTAGCRNSYIACPTGILAVDVWGGNVNDYTFTIQSAPDTSLNGSVVSATKSYNSTTGIYTCTLSGTNYPAGDYTIRVSDGCYNVTLTHTLPGFTNNEFPSPYTSPSYFYPTDIDNDCESVSWSPGSVGTTNVYYSHWLAGMYEVGIAPPNSEPETWTEWRSSFRKTMDIGPDYTLKDLYGSANNNKLHVYIRLKGCPSVKKDVGGFYLYDPFTNIESGVNSYSCDNYTYILRPYSYSGYGYYRMFCYPLTIRVMEGGINGEVVYNESGLSYTGATNIQLKYGIAHTYEITDANGYTKTGTISSQANPLSIKIGTTSITRIYDYICNRKYRLPYYVPIGSSSSYFHCSPVYVTITDSDGNVVKTIYSSSTGTTLSSMVSTDPAISTIHTTGTTSVYAELDYDKTYTLKAVYKDPNGEKPDVVYTIPYSRSYSTAIAALPTYYKLTASITSSTTCGYGSLTIETGNTNIYMPAGTVIEITGPDGYTSQTYTVPSTSLTTYAVNFSVAPLPSGEYKATITHPCDLGVIESNVVNVTHPTPTYRLALYNADRCNEDYGYFYIYVYSGTTPPNSTYEITGPEGYETQRGILNTGTGYTYPPSSPPVLPYPVSSPYTYLPPGEYTLTVTDGCSGEIITFPYTHHGVYSCKDLNYTTKNVCQGIEVTPTGLIKTYSSATSITTAYYRITSAKNAKGESIGYDNRVLTRTSNTSINGAFLIKESGTYTIGVMYGTTSTTGCVLREITVNCEVPIFSLDPGRASAYVCVGEEIGIMSLWTRNNFGDVSYQLWDEDDETQINNPNVPGEPVEEGRAVYLHGGPGETYTIRGFDTSEGCVKDFSQRITLTNLATERIITAEREKICEGDVIKLGCITLGETTYEWTGPNGFTSTDQNFVIPNATTDMTGTYTVTVCPEFCGDNVEEHIYIKVRECFIPVNPNVHVMK